MLLLLCEFGAAQQIMNAIPLAVDNLGSVACFPVAQVGLFPVCFFRFSLCAVFLGWVVRTKSGAALEPLFRNPCCCVRKSPTRI